jgi:hypothetical protein
VYHGVHGEPLYGLDAAVEMFTTPTQKVWIHSEESCEEPCPFHQPSKHHMIFWPLELAPDNSIRRVCPHGVLHADPDIMAHLDATPQYKLHICDGCCTPPDFPTRDEIRFQLDMLLELHYVDEQ